MRQRLANHTIDSPSRRAKNTPEDVLHTVIECKHAVENNGRDPTVLTMLNMYERKLYGMMRAAKSHGTSAIHVDILSEANAYVDMQKQQTQMHEEQKAPTDATAAETALPSIAAQKQLEADRAKQRARLRGGLER